MKRRGERLAAAGKDATKSVPAPSRAAGNASEIHESPINATKLRPGWPPCFPRRSQERADKRGRVCPPPSSAGLRPRRWSFLPYSGCEARSSARGVGAVGTRTCVRCTLSRVQLPAISYSRNRNRPDLRTAGRASRREETHADHYPGPPPVNVGSCPSLVLVYRALASVEIPRRDSAVKSDQLKGKMYYR